jgi:DNA repair protein RecN (Recombination protein N)
LLRRLRIENLVLIREADLELGPGLNAITGETGAGKTILAQAVGLLLGSRGDVALIGTDGREAYVEAELELDPGLLEEAGLEPIADLRPADEDGLVVARRIFPDGRTRAYAWGRSAAREDVAGLADRLIAMSGQFEQRRLSRPAYQLDVLDAFIGDPQQQRRKAARVAWADLLAARRRYDELQTGAAAEEARLADLRALAEDAGGFEPNDEAELTAERDRLRHVTELVEAAATAAAALDPEDGDGAASLAAVAERAVAPVERLAPELARAGDELRDVELRLRETASELRAFLASLDSDPARVDHVEAQLDRIAQTKRRFRARSYEELLARAAEARAELEAIEQGHDPAAAAEQALADAERKTRELADELHAARAEAAGRFADAVAAELAGIGMGDGEFIAQLGEREPGPTGTDEVGFLIRPNAGLPFAPVAETASGGELSRIALAIAAVAGGETMVFDEIDAGIGGETAHRVAETLRRLASRAQVVTITHLPQIASVAERHFRVEKIAGDPTHTRIEALDDEARREEIQRMLGGREFLSTVQPR